MISNVAVASAWRGIDPGAVARLRGADAVFWRRCLSAHVGPMTGAAAFLVASEIKPFQVVDPLGWVRREPGLIGIMSADVSGNIWTGELRHEAASPLSAENISFEITAGPIDPRTPPRPDRAHDPRRTIARPLFAVSEFAEAA